MKKHFPIIAHGFKHQAFISIGRLLWLPQQAKATFFRSLVVLESIDLLVTSDQVLPSVLASSTLWQDVVNRKLVLLQFLASVSTSVFVTLEDVLLGWKYDILVYNSTESSTYNNAGQTNRSTGCMNIIITIANWQLAPFFPIFDYCESIHSGFIVRAIFIFCVIDVKRMNCIGEDASDGIIPGLSTKRKEIRIEAQDESFGLFHVHWAV